MAFSYSFHISSKSHAVSNANKAGQVSKHNLREYKTKDYDSSLIKVLVGSDHNLVDNIKEIYKQEFEESRIEYNRGKRADRQIDDYFEHVSKSRNDVAVEIIIQVGDKDFWKGKSLSDRKIMDYIFKDQLKGLKQHCPDFKVASAVIHYDESSPHLHVVGVPVASGYQRGMRVQCAKTKVFTQESLSELQDKMRKRAEIGMQMNPNVFDGIVLKEKEKGRNKDIPKKSLDEYYSLQNDISSLIVKKSTAADDLKKEIELAKEKFGDPGTVAEEVAAAESRLSDVEKQIKEKGGIIDGLLKLIEKLELKIKELNDKYTKLEENPPEVKIIEKEVEVPKYVDTPRYIDVEKIVEVPKEVEVPKYVELNVDYKDMAERCLEAFENVIEWADSNYSCEEQMYDQLANQEDLEKGENFLRTWKTVYPRSRARVMPLTPEDGEEPIINSGSRGL